MDSHTVGLAHVLSPLAVAPVAYRTNEDGYYAAGQLGWTVPAWIPRLTAALRLHLQRPAHELPTTATQMA
jgi:hypothetical protein